MIASRDLRTRPSRWSTAYADGGHAEMTMGKGRTQAGPDVLQSGRARREPADDGGP